MALNPPQRDWRGQGVWLLGASTGIGRATAAALHARGARVTVSARPSAELQSFASAHPGSQVLALDCTDAAAVQTAAKTLLAQGQIDWVVYCAGYYTPQRATAFSLIEMRRHMDVNYTGALHLLDAVLPAMLAQGSGHISLVSSVAGYRGLPKSLAYGPSKAALTHLAEALYTDLRPRGIAVSAIHPGFVQTPLTADNAFPMPALISPEQAASEIMKGWERGEFDIHFPKRFTYWMKLLRVAPTRVFFAVARRLGRD